MSGVNGRKGLDRMEWDSVEGDTDLHGGTGKRVERGRGNESGKVNTDR